MTQIEWQELEAAVSQMTDADRQKLASFLASADSRVKPSSNPSLGLFADEPELIDEIMESVYIARETHPLRAEE